MSSERSEKIVARVFNTPKSQSKNEIGKRRKYFRSKGGGLEEKSKAATRVRIVRVKASGGKKGFLEEKGGGESLPAG